MAEYHKKKEIKSTHSINVHSKCLSIQTPKYFTKQDDTDQWLKLSGKKCLQVLPDNFNQRSVSKNCAFSSKYVKFSFGNIEL